MNTFSKFAAAAAAAFSVVAVSSPAHALIQFAQGTADVAPSFQWTQDGDGIGGTLSSIGSLWYFKEVLPASIMDGLNPASGVSAAFSFNAATQEAYACNDGVCGIAGLDGSFSYVYTGPDQEYSWYGNTRTLVSGANLLTVSFKNAWIQGTGAGSANISTMGQIPGTITSISSDVFNFDNSTDFEFAFGFSGGGLKVSPNGKNFNNFKVNGNGNFSAGAIPEPGTWALMILGFGGAGAMLRRRRAAFA